MAVGTAAVKTAGDFDQSMAKVKAITGSTGEDFQKLRDLAIDLGAKTAYSAVECADAMTEMGKAGWDRSPFRCAMEHMTTVPPEYYLRAKSNILSSGTSAEYADICTRIYPLGYGEGVNQLTIRDVNNGLPYLQSPDTIVARYGLIEKVLVDRRFENPESLKAYAQTMLDNLQTPHFARTFDVTDLYPLTSQNLDDAEVGKVCKMTGDGSIAYITKTVHQWDEAGSLQIELSTKATDVASRVADLADRVRIESVYAQGATQLYQHSKDANATAEKGMTLNLYFPSEMRQINKKKPMPLHRFFYRYDRTRTVCGESANCPEDGYVLPDAANSAPVTFLLPPFCYSSARITRRFR